MNDIIVWISSHQNILVLSGMASIIIFIVSLLSLPWLVAKIPEDYFVPKKRAGTPWKGHFLGLWLLMFAVKNVVGYLLLFSGFLMLFLPGQGILTILTGLLLMDYPGKFQLERKIALSPAVLSKLNWLREKANQPPLKIDY
ncbi:MAG: PGPGW domain-containing protein [Pseudomonadales bacterium]